MINGCTSWRWTPQKSMGSRRNPSWACLAAITRVPCIRRQAASARWEFPCPAGYLHTPSCVLQVADITATYDLLMKLSEAYAVCD